MHYLTGIRHFSQRYSSLNLRITSSCGVPINPASISASASAMSCFTSSSVQGTPSKGISPHLSYKSSDSEFIYR